MNKLHPLWDGRYFGFIILELINIYTVNVNDYLTQEEIECGLNYLRACHIIGVNNAGS